MSDSDKQQKVRIHIDRVPYEVENPISGARLYEIGSVASHKDLFREASGNHEDELVTRETQEIHLKGDQHFYSQKEFTLIVNAEEKNVTGPQVTFDQILLLAYPTPPQGQNVVITITYRKGPHINQDGILLTGNAVYIKNRMIFDVTPTDKS